MTRDEGAAASRRALSICALAVGLVLACRRETGPPVLAAGAPRRVVTLAPNLTEIVFALGAGNRLVGASEYSDYPEAARAVARVGGLQVDAEKVAALRPDLVLAVAEGNAQASVRALEAAGLPVVVTPSGSLDSVLETIRIVADRLGVPAEGRRLADDLSRRRAAVRAEVAGRSRRPRALLLVWPDPPQAAGGGTFLDDVLTEAGAANLVADRRGWPVLSAEWVATAPVELLVAPDSVEARAAWDAGFASGSLSRGPISGARRVRLDEAALTRPGPRVFDMLERLAEATR